MKANTKPNNRTNNGLYSMNPFGETMDINLKKVKFNFKEQVVMSESLWKLKESYTTKSGQVKNRYIINENAKPLKIVKH